MAYPRNFSDLELVKHLEQIEAVQFQLKNNSILGARIALFLLDSLADIITYHFISQFPHELRITDKQISQITKNFLERVKFIKKELGCLDDQEYQFIVEMRRLRNEAFHEAKLREDDVIICLVKIYYRIIVNLLKVFISELDPGDQYNLIININHENLNHLEEQKLINYIKSKGLLAEFLRDDFISYGELIEKVLSQYELEADNVSYIYYEADNVPYIYSKKINEILSNDLINRINILNQNIIYEIYCLGLDEKIKEYFDKLPNNEPINQRNDQPISEKDIDYFLQYIKDEYAMGNISKKQIDKWKSQAKKLLDEHKIHDPLRKWGEIDQKLSKLSNIRVLLSAAKANEGKIKTQFKGNISLKTTPENHHKISIAAEKSGMDINSWIDEILTNAAEKAIDA